MKPTIRRVTAFSSMMLLLTATALTALGEISTDANARSATPITDASWPCALTTNFASVTYLKADASGANDGTSWVNAFTSLTDAILAATDGNTTDGVVVAAQGLYKIPGNTEIVVSNKLTLIGGYQGVNPDLSLDARDTDLYQTIISADVNDDNTWWHYLPDFDNYTAIFTNTCIPIVQNGRINIPEPVGKYDFFTVSADGNRNDVKDTTSGMFCFTTDGSCCDIEGIWFTGSRASVVPRGAITFASNTRDSRIADCRFVGNTHTSGGGGTSGALGFGSQGTKYVAVVVTNSLFTGINACDRGACLNTSAGQSICRLYDCTISGVNGSSFGATAFYNWGRGSEIYLSGSRFEKIAAAGMPNANYGGAGLVFCAEGGTASFTLDKCVVSDCWGISTSEYDYPLISAGYFNANMVCRNTLFAHNVSYVKPTSERAYSFFHPNPRYSGGNAYFFDGCTFMSNCIYALNLQATLTEGTWYALGIVGCDMRTMVANCSFIDNDTVAADKPGVTAYQSRGVVSGVSGTFNLQSKIAVVNSTFSGRGTKPFAVNCGLGLQSGNDNTMLFVNSVFRNDDDENSLVVAATDDYGKIDFYNSTFAGCEYPNNNGGVITNCSFQPVSLGPIEYPEGDDGARAAPVRRLAARTPDICQTADVLIKPVAVGSGVAEKGYYARAYSYRLPGETTWQNCITHYYISAASDAAPEVPVPLPDALGEERAFGTFTRGAVEALTPEAAEGYTLTIVRNIHLAGSFSRQRDNDWETFAAQVVPSSNQYAIVPVTAVPNATNNAQFLGWYSSPDFSPTSLISTDTTLTAADFPSGITSDTTIYANFVTPDVTITFSAEYTDEDGVPSIAGTFSNGQTTHTVTLPVGSKFPELPQFNVNDDLVFLGYDSEFPLTVPGTDTEYHVRVVTKNLRIIRCITPDDPTVVPGQQTVRDGRTWATAYTNILDAYNDAALYRGEVWLKTGRFVLSGPVTMRSNVALRGGFAGNETAASEADPDANPTVLSSIPYSGKTHFRWSDTYGYVWTNADVRIGFNNPPDPPEGSYLANANSIGSTVVGVSAVIGDSAATNVVFSGIHFSEFSRNDGTPPIYINNNSSAIFSNVTFSALCNAGNGGTFAMGIASDAVAHFIDCRFIHLTRIMTISGATDGGTNIFERCLFRGISSDGFFIGNDANVVIRDSRFEHSSYERNYIGRAASLVLNNVEVFNCRATGSYAFFFLASDGGSLIVDNLRCEAVSTYGANPMGAVVWTMSNAYAEFKNSCFVRCQNKYFNSTTSRNPRGSVASSWVGKILFVNCTFASNSVGVAEEYVNTLSAQDYARGTVSTKGNGKIALVHCAFIDNVTGKDGMGDVAIGGGTANTGCSIVNCYFTSSYAYYRPLVYVTDGSYNQQAPLLLASSLPGFDAAEQLSNPLDGCLVRDVIVTDSVTKAPNGMRISPDGVMAWPVADSKSKIVRAVPVYVAPDGTPYVRDPSDASMWRSLFSQNSVASVTGLDEMQSPLYPDAFGNERSRSRIPNIGPLNTAGPGTMLWIR